jgi:Putative DNA-binding domain
VSDDLRRLQDWFRGAILDPDLDVAPDRVLRSSTRLGAARRLELYRRSYRLRLLEAMRAFHPGLRHMLGDELFDEFALDYIRARPSRSYSLHRLGQGFADHLAATRPDLDGAPEAWPSMIVDLARLERTFAEVYDAPGVEGDELPAARDLPDEPDGRWLAATAIPVRCLRLVRSSFPAGPYLSAVRRDEDPPLPAPAASFVAVNRRDYVVTLTPLEAREHQLLELLLTDGARIEAAASGAGIEPVEAWRLVRRWADHAFFRSLEPVKETVTS